MKKYFLPALAAVFFAMPSFAQYSPDYNEAKEVAYLKSIGEKFKKWIPKGWFIESVAEGDLNDDGIPDVAFVASSINLKDYSNDSNDSPLHSKMFIFMNEGNDYSLFQQTASYVDDRGMTPRGRPEAHLEIDKRILSVQIATPFPSWSEKRAFRMEDDRLRLIGKDEISFYIAYGVAKETSYNFLTGKCQEKVEFNGESSEKAKILKELKLKEGSVWKRIKGNKKIYFGDTDDMLECQ